jgi:hypothetical protein
MSISSYNCKLKLVQMMHWYWPFFLSLLTEQLFESTTYEKIPSLVGKFSNRFVVSTNVFSYIDCQLTYIVYVKCSFKFIILNQGHLGEEQRGQNERNTAGTSHRRYSVRILRDI